LEHKKKILAEIQAKKIDRKKWEEKIRKNQKTTVYSKKQPANPP
jgi:hypothetical protein